MSLTPQELQHVLETHTKAKAGDPFAIRFFADLKAQNTTRAREFLNARDNFEAESTSGVMVDPGLQESLGLTAQQMKDCKEATFRYAKGDRAAITFFMGCQRGMDAGVQASAAMLTMRDAILATLGQGDAPGTIPAVGAAGVHPPPMVQGRMAGTVAPNGQAFTQAAVDVRAAKQAQHTAPPAGPSADPQDPRTYTGTAESDPASFFGGTVTHTPPAREAPSRGALDGVSPDVVMSLPPLTAAGFEMMKVAIAQGKLFSPAVVLTLVHELEKLQGLAASPGNVNMAVNENGANGPFIASPASPEASAPNGHA